MVTVVVVQTGGGTTVDVGLEDPQVDMPVVTYVQGLEDRAVSKNPSEANEVIGFV